MNEEEIIKSINKIIYNSRSRLRKLDRVVTNSNIIVILKTRIETLEGVLRMYKR